jgi:hypothetical protein
MEGRGLVLLKLGWEEDSRVDKSFSVEVEDKCFSMEESFSTRKIFSSTREDLEGRNLE